MRRFILVLAVLMLACVATPPAINPNTTTITHVFIIVQENRSPDELFQCLGPNGYNTANISVNGVLYNPGGAPIPTPLQPVPLYLPTPLPSQYPHVDPGHTHGDWLAQWDAGAMDGWSGINNNGQYYPFNETYVPFQANPTAYPSPIPGSTADSGADATQYCLMARNYMFADKFFSDIQGPSFPAHVFLIAGQGTVDNPHATPQPCSTDPHPVCSIKTGTAAAENSKGGVNNTSQVEGCDSGNYQILNGANPLKVRTIKFFPLLTPAPSLPPSPVPTESPETYPCYDMQTIPDEIQAQKNFQGGQLYWRYYQEFSDFGLWQAPDAIWHLRYINPDTGKYEPGGGAGSYYCSHNKHPSSQVLTDLLAGSPTGSGYLTNVTWIIPAGDDSDHPGNHPIYGRGGPAWVSAIVNEIGNSDLWNHSVIFVTWDDWGGFYDHVPPPNVPPGRGILDNYQRGFRVPLLIISGFQSPAPGTVVTKYSSFCSILNFVTADFGLPHLNTQACKKTSMLEDFQELFNTSPGTTPRPFVPIVAPSYVPGTPQPQFATNDDDNFDGAGGGEQPALSPNLITPTPVCPTAPPGQQSQ